MSYSNNVPHKPELVLITGATGGFGSAFARRFAALGSKLVLVGRRTEKLNSLRDELKTEVYTVELDIRGLGSGLGRPITVDDGRLHLGRFYSIRWGCDILSRHGCTRSTATSLGRDRA